MATDKNILVREAPKRLRRAPGAGEGTTAPRPFDTHLQFTLDSLQTLKQKSMHMADSKAKISFPSPTKKEAEKLAEPEPRHEQQAAEVPAERLIAVHSTGSILEELDRMADTSTGPDAAGLSNDDASRGREVQFTS